MRPADIAELLDDITPPPVESAYAAVRPLGDRADAFVGWESPETAVLLLPLQDGPCPEIRLRHLDVLPVAEVTLRRPGNDELEVRAAAVLRCRCEDGGIRLAFETVVTILFDALEAQGSLDLNLQIPSLERLFRAFQHEALTTVVGLWAELAIMTSATDVVAAVMAWHGDPRANFDFRSAGRALDVKATRDAAREHWISLDQWRAVEHATCEIASLVVPPMDAGLSVVDLLARLGVQLQGQPALRSKVIEIAARTLGRDFPRVASERFDLDAAMGSLRFVALEDVPHGAFDPGVLDARWKASLEHIGWSSTTTWTSLAPAADG